MLGEKQRAAGTAPRQQHQLRVYNKPERLSSQIDYLLAGFLFLVQGDSLSRPERTTTLNLFEGLLRLKVNLKQDRGVRHDY